MSEQDVERTDDDVAPEALAEEPASMVETEQVDPAPASEEAPESASQETPDPEPEEAPPLEVEEIAAVEAILFTTDTQLSLAKIAEVADLTGGRRAAREAIEILNGRYAEMGCSFRIETQAGGYRMLTLPEFNDVLGRLLKVRSQSKLSRAALETLAIIAYKQPMLRADIEAIRGVASGEMVRGLMEKGLAKIVGRAEEIGRPMLYGTTTKFLEVFGMNSLKDLPEVAELATAAARAPKVAEDVAEEPSEADTDEAAEPAEGERPQPEDPRIESEDVAEVEAESADSD